VLLKWCHPSWDARNLLPFLIPKGVPIGHLQIISRTHFCINSISFPVLVHSVIPFRRFLCLTFVTIIWESGHPFWRHRMSLPHFLYRYDPPPRIFESVSFLAHFSIFKCVVFIAYPSVPLRSRKKRNETKDNGYRIFCP
jgi:hypothetical protein